MSRFQNYDTIATTPLRRDALAIADAAYEAIDTDTVVRAALSLEGDTIVANGQRFSLADYDRVRVIGFGKASCKAVQTIESILKGYIQSGVAIDIHAGTCDIVSIEEGSHPRPSPQNVKASERIVSMAQGHTERDLFLVVVSGGGSSLFCWPYDECEQGARLYEDFKKTGATIEEMNTVRKHISKVKGGGLSAMLYPATVIGLVFCDVPGDHFEEVASGPTYLDASTVADAQAVLDRYGLTGYTLNETPKDASLFRHVVNIPVVSNTRAIDAMASKAKELGYRPVVAGSAMYDETAELVTKLRGMLSDKTAVVGGGEPRLVVTKKGGKGGRNQYTALRALVDIPDNELMLPFASDGRDNCDAAGGIADTETKRKGDALGLRIEDSLESFDTYTYFEKTAELLITGPTDSNVSDLFVYLRA
jgi:glycerate-2-kinase